MGDAKYKTQKSDIVFSNCITIVTVLLFSENAGIICKLYMSLIDDNKDISHVVALFCFFCFGLLIVVVNFNHCLYNESILKPISW